MPISKVYNIDCMEYMKSIPDEFFDLAVVDPPYGLGCATWGMGGTADRRSPARKIYKERVNQYRHSVSGKLKDRILNKSEKKFENWDVAPSKEYFDELFRVSKNQIIWGGNYFELPPTRCIICWDKMQPWPNFSQVEMAWTSFDYPAKIFRFDNRTTDKIHPTQKPISLYAWIFENFAKEGDKILDTHLGSGSSRIAAYKMGFDFYATEIDAEFFDAQEKRFREECFGEIKTKKGTVIQTSLFD